MPNIGECEPLTCNRAQPAKVCPWRLFFKNAQTEKTLPPVPLFVELDLFY